MKKGFTLIELLAVIVIVGIILAIAIPTITGVISNTTKSAFEADAKMVLKAIEYKKLEDEDFDVTTIDETNVESILKIDDVNYQSISVELVGTAASITITGKNKWNNLVAHGTIKNIAVETLEDYVIDEIAPVITLVGDKVVKVTQGDTYNDLGATALDDVDGDITDNIIVTSDVNYNVSGSYSIVYTVSDSAGNYADPVVRIINVIDSAPVITILGSNPVTISKGDTYSDAGAAALDPEDGDITGDIEVTSTVNPNLTGMYTVTYNVTDSSGNEGVATRTVYVSDVVSVSFTTSQSWTIPSGISSVDVFLVGGGGGGGYQAGGGGGYTKSYGNISVVAGNTAEITIGAGGIIGGPDGYSGTDGGYSEFLYNGTSYKALGGKGSLYNTPTNYWNGGDGGSGGGGYGNMNAGVIAGDGGSDGSDGETALIGEYSQYGYGGTGQGYSTRAFWELDHDATATLYAGGGGGIAGGPDGVNPGAFGSPGAGGGGGYANGYYLSPVAPTPNSGGGGAAGSNESIRPGADGIVIVRYCMYCGN